MCDGSIAVKIIIVNTASQQDAENKAKVDIPAGSEVLELQVEDKTQALVEQFEAFDETEAAEKAKGFINARESSYKSVAEIICVLKPKAGFLGMGKKPGTWEAKYSLAQKEVTTRYRPLARIKVLYGSQKLKCTQCGNVMSTTTEGVHYHGQAPTAEAAIVKLRCDKCDITRFEKRWEVEGEWIAWEDGAITVVD